jgi:hypothetical protein
MEKRVLNYRTYYNFTEAWSDPSIPGYNQNISGNYYPINSAISIQDVNSKRRMTVMNDRSQGGTSIAPGTIELM